MHFLLPPLHKLGLPTAQAAVLSDVVVLYVVKKHDMYYGRKYLMMKEYDQEQGEGGEEEKVWGRGAICMEVLL